MHFADSIVIFLLALVLFGPKRLPEIGRQIGKLLAEFRRASNDFKMQIDDELRAIEQQERQRKLEEAAAPQAAVLPAPETLPEPTILPPAAVPLSISPPSTGEPVSTVSPYAAVTPPELPDSGNVTAESSSLDVASLDAGSIGSNGHADVPDATALNGTDPQNEHAPLHHG